MMTERGSMIVAGALIAAVAACSGGDASHARDGSTDGIPPGGWIFTVAPLADEVRVRSGRTLSIERTLRGVATLLHTPTGVAVHVDRGEVFVANSGDDSITVYDLLASENTAPVRRIAGPLTGVGRAVRASCRRDSSA
jgi:hypothetical protein